MDNLSDKDRKKKMKQQFHESYALGDVRLVRQIAVRLAIEQREGLSEVKELLVTTDCYRTSIRI